MDIKYSAVPVYVPARREVQRPYEEVAIPDYRHEPGRNIQDASALQNFLDFVIFTKEQTETGSEVSGRDLIALFAKQENASKYENDDESSLLAREIMSCLPQRPLDVYTQNLIRALQTACEIGLLETEEKHFQTGYVPSVPDSFISFIARSRNELSEEGKVFLEDTLEKDILGGVFSVAFYLQLRASGISQRAYLLEHCDNVDYARHPTEYLDGVELQAASLDILAACPFQGTSLYIHPKVLCHDRAELQVP